MLVALRLCDLWIDPSGRGPAQRREHHGLAARYWSTASGLGAASGETLPLYGPSDGNEIARIARGGREDIDRAVKAARHAFEGVWGGTAAVDRGGC